MLGLCSAACLPRAAPPQQLAIPGSDPVAALRVAVSPGMTVVKMQSALLETAHGVCGPHRHPVVIWGKDTAAVGHRLRIDWGSGALEGRLVCDEKRVQEIRQSPAFRKLVYVSMRAGRIVVVDPDSLFRETPLAEAGAVADVGASYVNVDAREIGAFGESQAIAFLKTLAAVSEQFRALIYPLVMELLA